MHRDRVAASKFGRQGAGIGRLAECWTAFHAKNPRRPLPRRQYENLESMEGVVARGSRLNPCQVTDSILNHVINHLEDLPRRPMVLLDLFED